MAHKRRKRRTQTPGQTGNAQANGLSKTNPADRTPKSMVIRMGASDVGPAVTQLVKDMRNVMEPHTASRLKERRSNRLRDYTTMAGPLGVTHLLLFSRSASGNTNMRLATTPRGPTFHFRVDNYSLCKDIVKAQRRPKAGGSAVEHLSPPLLVMNNFTTPTSTATTSIPKHLETLATSIFQSLFPPISPQRTPLSSIRRVLLLNRDTAASTTGTYSLSLRHYAITSRALVPLSRGLKRLRAASAHAKTRPQKPQPTRAGSSSSGAAHGGKSSASLPNLSRLDDVADYLLDPAAAGGYTSASETDADTDAEVEVLEADTARVLSRRDRVRQQQQRANGEASGDADTGAGGADGEAKRAAPAQKRAIRLTELGPRMKLRLVKVEEGMCDGKVLWHEFVTKTEAEERAMDAVWEERRKEREERRRVQRENVARKRGDKGKGGDGDGDGEMDEDIDEDDDEWDDDFDDDEMVDAAEEGELEDEGDEVDA